VVPALESIGFRRFASAADRVPATPPKRAVFLGMGFAGLGNAEPGKTPSETRKGSGLFSHAAGV